MLIKKYLIILLFFSAPSLLFSLNLKEKFTHSKKGDYIVTEQNKTFTLLHIHTINEKKLILEEISIPSHQVKQKQFNWKKWVLEGAKGHTSWIAYEIDLLNDKILECYSFNKQTFLSIHQIDSFLMILFKLDLKELPDAEKRRIGPPPPPGEVDHRKIWSPPQYFNGIQVSKPTYHAYKSLWPKDETELSGKEILLYFDQENKVFPFPYWIQIADGNIKFKIRTVDSGINLESPRKELPRKSPSFLGGAKKMGNTLSLTIKFPGDFSEYQLFAVDITSHPYKTLTLPFTSSQNGDLLHFSVQEKELQNLFTRGHNYIWVVLPKNSTLFVECPHPYVWSGAL